MLIGGNIIILKPSFRAIQKNLISLKKRLVSLYSLHYLKPYNLIAKGMPSTKIWKTNFRWLAQSQSQWAFRCNRSPCLRPKLCNNRLYSKTNKQYQTTTISGIIDFSKVAHTPSALHVTDIITFRVSRRKLKGRQRVNESVVKNFFVWDKKELACLHPHLSTKIWRWIKSSTLTQ